MEQKQKNKMIPALIDQVMMWMIIFVSFVVILFMVIDYSSIMRIKGNVDIMAEYAARMIALGKSEDEVATNLNNMKNSYFANISGANISCSSSTTETYQVIFNITGLYDDVKVLNIQNDIASKRVVFNEVSSDQIECNLVLTKQ